MIIARVAIRHRLSAALAALFLHRLSAAVAALFLLLLPLHAFAAAQFIGPANTSLPLEVSKGKLVRLDRPAASVFIADPEIADVQVKSPTLVYVLGKSAGETTLYAVGDRDEVILNVGVVVRHNISRLKQALSELMPSSAVEVTSVDDSIVLEGIAYSASEAEDIRKITAKIVPDAGNIVNKMRLEAPTQVNLRVRVAEMSRETIKSFGFNWDAVLSPGSFVFGLATGNPVLAAAGAAGKVFNTRGSAGTSQGNFNNLFGGFTGGRVDVNTVIDALDKEGLVTVLAEPNLTATSGELASFLAGGEFPIPVSQQNNQISIEFKKFGVGLDFVANIGANGRINLRVRPEVSQLSSNGAITLNTITIPAIATRRAETTVELGSGQSFAIAGLLQNNVTQDISKFPWLGDVPILGTLFRSDKFQRNETELVIIVTPYIVRPVSARKLMAATDGYVMPSDAERIIGGANHRPQLNGGPALPLSRSGTTLVGPVGFDLE